MVVEKCLGSNRSGTKLKGMEVLMMYIEVENKGDGVVVSWVTLSTSV
jgi:hypothetical protein